MAKPARILPVLSCAWLRALHVSGTTADLPFVVTIVGDSFK